MWYGSAGMKFRVSIGVVCALGAAGLVWTCSAGLDNAGGVPEDLLFTVRRGKLTVTITENGTLMAKHSEKIGLASRGWGTITNLVEEGKTVSQGEVLCRLDVTSLEEKMDELELNILKTEADLNTARTELEIEVSDNKANLEKAQNALTKAEKDLERYQSGDVPRERRRLDIAGKEAETEYNRAQELYESSKTLHEKKFITRIQFEQDRIDLERAEIRLAGSKLDLELFERYTLPMTTSDKEAILKETQRVLANTAKRAQSKLRQAEVEVQSRERRLDSLTKNLVRVKERIQKFTITSPCFQPA